MNPTVFSPRTSSSEPLPPFGHPLPAVAERGVEIQARGFNARSDFRGSLSRFGALRRSCGLGTWFIASVLVCLSLSTTAAIGATPEPTRRTAQLPVRGLHTSAPSKRELARALAFIRGPLADAGLNTLILEFNTSFDFKSRPEFADPAALNRDDVRQIARACREKRIQLIPMINCLGHQSWAERNDRFLTKHPEFDETPGKFPGNKDIYCRSYCPLHPDVHAVLFDLMDELIEASSAKAFHVGMDEVFILADPDCPRCRGKDRAQLFADEVTRLRDHLKAKGCRTWMWGDRFLDGKATGLGEWEASMNATAPAIDMVPRDIVICDWHYEAAPDTARIFAGKGFDVVGCPWRKVQPALGQLSYIREIRAGADRKAARHALGMVQTTWCGFDNFMKQWEAQHAGAKPEKSSASEVVRCFNALFEAMRNPR